MPGVSKVISPTSVTGGVDNSNNPRNTLSITSTSGVVVAVNDEIATPSFFPQQQQSATPPGGAQTSTGLAFDEEAKLVYGVVISLRNMVKKLSGR